MKLAIWRFGLCLSTLLWTGAGAVNAGTVKLTGWFACEKCTAARAANGDLHPSNPVCAKECIRKGSEPVFISEQGKELLKVRNYASVTDDLGYHVEVTGEVDEASKSISIAGVKKLEYEGAACSRPRPKKQ